jgi:hypothetical protein
MRLLNEPLLHFLVLGMALFGLYGLFGTKQAEELDKVIVSAAQIAYLQQTFARTWQRQPTPEELGLVRFYGDPEKSARLRAVTRPPRVLDEPSSQGDGKENRGSTPCTTITHARELDWQHRYCHRNPNRTL